MKIEKQTILIADENHYITNGETIGSVISLGKNDSIDNWREITAEEAEELQKEWEVEE